MREVCTVWYDGSQTAAKPKCLTEGVTENPRMIHLFKMRGAVVCLATGAMAVGLGLGGCSGAIGPGSGTAPSTGSAGTAGGSGSGGLGTAGATIPVVPCTDLTKAKPGRKPLRRLNLAEYARTVHDLLNVDTSTVTASFPPDNTALGFTNNA